jgi:hypothetical protein
LPWGDQSKFHLFCDREAIDERAALCVLSIHPAVINAESTFIFLALMLAPSRLQLQRQE